MAISITISPAGLDPLTQIADTTRAIRTINATITGVSDDVSETIESVTATLGESEPGVVITNGVSSVSIVGKYVDPFEDIFTYVEKGSSDLIETPKEVISVRNMPPNKDFYNLDQDTRAESIRNYTIRVKTNMSSYNFGVTHTIYNEWEGLRTFVADYY